MREGLKESPKPSPDGSPASSSHRLLCNGARVGRDSRIGLTSRLCRANGGSGQEGSPKSPPPAVTLTSPYLFLPRRLTGASGVFENTIGPPSPNAEDEPMQPPRVPRRPTPQTPPRFSARDEAAWPRRNRSRSPVPPQPPGCHGTDSRQGPQASPGPEPVTPRPPRS